MTRPGASAMLMFILSEATADPSSTLLTMAAKYGIWALAAIMLGLYVLKNDQRKSAEQRADSQDMAKRLREIEDYQRNTLQDMVEENTKALQAVAIRMEGCPNNHTKGVVAP